MTNYICEGIGKGAICGADAPVAIPSNKWNSETEKIEQIVVHLCRRHADELRQTMEEKFKSGRICPKT
jgi:hypothetical protein